MEINRAAFGALAIIGVVAAGGGAYIANRANPTEVPSVSTPYPTSMTGTVIETENSIASAPAPRAESPAPAENEIVARNTARPAAPARSEKAAPARTAPPVADRSRPSNPAPSPTYTPPSAPVDPPVTAAIEPFGSATVESTPVAPEPFRPEYEELVVPADSVIGLQVENALSSDRAKVEDEVRARVARDVKVRDQVAIPAGARAEGSITLVDKGGRLKDQARLGIRFHTIVLADGTRLPINTETIYRDGDSPARESAAKIGGGAVGGAVLGAILGGKKGAIIGSTVGAAGGGVAVATSEPNPATLPAGSTVTVRMSSPAAVTIQK
jgi:hypothetical protein